MLATHRLGLYKVIHERPKAVVTSSVGNAGPVYGCMSSQKAQNGKTPTSFRNYDSGPRRSHNSKHKLRELAVTCVTGYSFRIIGSKCSPETVERG